MGKPIVREFGQARGILKYFDYLGFAALIPSTGVVADANGNKIVKAGTPYPSNDGECVGYLLADVDVTQGDAPGTIVYEGSLDETKITANGITVASAAKAATPRVTFFD